MTLKADIFEALSTLNIPVAYRDSDVSELPRISYALIGSFRIKASNSVHRRVYRYQVDIFSDTPLEIEDDQLLKQAEANLKALGIRVGAWREFSDIEIEEELGLYTYTTEVWR